MAEIVAGFGMPHNPGAPALVAREGDRGLETIAGEISAARVVALEAIVTCLDDLRRRLETVQRLQARMATRDQVLEAVADLVPIPAPEALIDTETRRRLARFVYTTPGAAGGIENPLAALQQALELATAAEPLE